MELNRYVGVESFWLINKLKLKQQEILNWVYNIHVIT